MSIAIRAVTPDLRERAGRALGELERSVCYPLGDDSFRIDHGADYFAFFDRLGEVRAWIAEQSHSGRIVGGLVAVRRRAPEPMANCWYLCDLKVSGWHGVSVGRKLLIAFGRLVGRAATGYGISMNPAGSRSNPMIRFVGRMLPVAIDVATLHLYSLDYDEVLGLEPAIREARGGFCCRDLRPLKAIVLESTKQPMPLLHVEFGATDDQKLIVPPTAGHVHMLCTPAGDPLDRTVIATGAKPSASATVLSRSMPGAAWQCVVSSEI